MSYIDQTLELLLSQYHASTDANAVAAIEAEVKRRTLCLDDMALIHNAYYHHLNLGMAKRNGLRKWAVAYLEEESIFLQTHQLSHLYYLIGGQGEMGVFITRHLKERLVKCGDWHQIVLKFEQLEWSLTACAAKYILRNSNDVCMLADVHAFTLPQSKLRLRYTEKILSLQANFTYVDWEEIAQRCANPSSLWFRSHRELDKLYAADEKDHTSDSNPRKK